jgi:hypothetical protein
LSGIGGRDVGARGWFARKKTWTRKRNADDRNGDCRGGSFTRAPRRGRTRGRVRQVALVPLRPGGPGPVALRPAPVEPGPAREARQHFPSSRTLFVRFPELFSSPEPRGGGVERATRTGPRRVRTRMRARSLLETPPAYEPAARSYGRARARGVRRNARGSPRRAPANRRFFRRFFPRVGGGGFASRGTGEAADATRKGGTRMTNCP